MPTSNEQFKKLVEESFETYSPLYLVTAASITDDWLRRQFLVEMWDEELQSFEHFVRTTIASLVNSFEGYAGEKVDFMIWVNMTAKVYERWLAAEYVYATIDKSS